MNLSEHIGEQLITEEKIQRFGELTYTFARSIYSDQFSVTTFDNGRLDLEYFELEQLESLGLDIRVVISATEHRDFFFPNVDESEFLLDLLFAMPEDFTADDLITYLSDALQQHVVPDEQGST